MGELLRGQRVSIRKLCGGLELDVEIFHKASVTIDVTCFGLDAAGKLSDEHYFVFYNQKSTPEGAVVLTDDKSAIRFHLQLDRLPPQIEKLSFTAAIDGTRTLQELEKGVIRLLRNGQEVARHSYSRADFRAERAIVIGELYRKGDDWRFNPVSRGFNGGLKALVENFGGTVAPSGGRLPGGTRTGAGRSGGSRTGSAPSRGDPVQNLVAALPDRVLARMDDLARQCRGDTAYLESLYRNMFASLAGYPDAADSGVQVVLCADASGSMYDMYRNGRVQRAVDKFFTFASTISERPSMDAWAFGAKSRQFDAVTMDNVRDYTFAETGGFERWMSLLNYQYNNEPEAMRDIMMMYGGLHKPIMVLFLTDGRLQSDWEIEEILIKTSRVPLYWQFIGLHGEEYGVLDRLDDIDGRRTNNAGFLRTDDIDDLTDRQLFDCLLANLSDWLKEIHKVGLV